MLAVIWIFRFFFVVNFSALNLSYSDHGTKLIISLVGALKEYSNTSDKYFIVNVQNRDRANVSEIKVYGIDRSSYELTTMSFDFYPDVLMPQPLNLTFTMATNFENPIAFQLIVDANAIMPEVGVASAAIILIFFNVLLGAEVTILSIHSTLLCSCAQCATPSNEWNDYKQIDACDSGDMNNRIISDCSSNCSGYFYIIYVDRYFSNVTRSTFHGWYNNMDRLWDDSLNIFDDGSCRYFNWYRFFWAHCCLHISSTKDGKTLIIEFYYSRAIKIHFSISILARF